MTKAASEFVTPLSLQALSGNHVFTDNFDVSQEANFGHLDLARWADVFVVAPATADLIARLDAGIANDCVTTPLSAFKKQILLCPAMNTNMWENEATVRNMTSLRSRKNTFVEGPSEGVLADGDVGFGRLAELEDIMNAIARLALTGPLSGSRVLVTAGPTREAIDPVRFLSNPSTGKMGIAMAQEARSLGAEVTVVLGPVPEIDVRGLEVIRVTSADEMLMQVMHQIEGIDCFVACAAVSDFKPEVFSPLKIKKTEVSPETLKLVRTPDILKTVALHIETQPTRPVLVGFAAETHQLIEYATRKLEDKTLDFIVANQVSSDQGFATDDNRVTLITKGFAPHTFDGPKRFVASQLWQHIAPRVKRSTR
jgi:phosphopantothenoylcysteine decarboxylase / phosphopantothenate---cysteine ligase